METNFRKYAADVILRDGECLHIRAIHPDDKPALLDGFYCLSEQSIYFRFLGSKSEISEKELMYFTEVDFVHHVGLVATLPIDGRSRIVGVGRYVASISGNSSQCAELALLVGDAYQDRGIGTVLFEHLMSIARTMGIREFEAEIFAENHRMFHLLCHQTFPLQCIVKSETVHVRFSI